MLPPPQNPPRPWVLGGGADKIPARYWRVVVGRWMKHVHCDTLMLLDASVVGWCSDAFSFCFPNSGRCHGARSCAIFHEQSSPVAAQRSVSLYQYWYWADRSLARSREDPTLQPWLMLILSFKNLQALSMTCVPAFTVIFFLVPGMVWVTRRTKVGLFQRHFPLIFTRFLQCTTLSCRRPGTLHL